MIYREMQNDLFSVPESYMLVHCISSDFALGAGIAKVFRDTYYVRKNLLEQYREHYNHWNGKGYCLITRQNSDRELVANLVTKDKYYQKPTYDTLQQALCDLNQQLKQSACVSQIAMPFIGCGLDKLEWSRVRTLIQEVFKDTDIEIMVCYQSEYRKAKT